MFHFNQKKKFVFIFLWSFLLFSLPVNAEELKVYDIHGHYFVKQDPPSSTYKDMVQWTISNSNEWLRFVEKFSKLPPKPIVDPMKSGEEDIVYIKQVNPDKMTGNSVFLSKSGIVQISKMPYDYYHIQDKTLFNFLELERAKRAEYGSDKSVIKDIKQPGIIVIYRGSSTIENPGWIINTKEEMKPYIKILNQLKRMYKGEVMRMEIEKTTYDDVGSYSLYLNYQHPYAQFLSVDSEGGVRASNIKTVKTAYQDQGGYYQIFKNNALNVINGKALRENQEKMKADKSRF